MNLEELRTYAQTLPYGKRLPDAVYLFRPQQSDVPPELWVTMRRAETAAQPDSSWNLLKIHTDHRHLRHSSK